MALDNTQKLVKAVTESLADTRTNVIASVNQIVFEADRNPWVQNHLWQFVITYLYNRATRYELGLYKTTDQEYIMERCHKMVSLVLEPEYKQFRKTGAVSDVSDLTEYDFGDYTDIT